MGRVIGTTLALPREVYRRFERTEKQEFGWRSSVLLSTVFEACSMKYITKWRAMSDEATSKNFRGLLRHGMLSTLAYISKPQPGPSLRLLYCHYVFDDQVVDFDAKIRYLASIGSFLTADEVLAVVRGEKGLNNRNFHLSFDDGFRNIITNALPILREYGVPATFFVPTSIISTDDETLRQYCQNITNYPAMIEIATWDDLAIAQEQGLTIASHTRTHSRFSDISGSAAQLEHEIIGSKEDLERRLGRPCRYISWPYGTITDADTNSLDYVKRAGYDACFGAFRGRIVPGKTDIYYIPRHHFEAQWPIGHFKYFAHGGMESRQQ